LGSRKKLEARKRLIKRADSHLSGARGVRRREAFGPAKGLCNRAASFFQEQYRTPEFLRRARSLGLVRTYAALVLDCAIPGLGSGAVIVDREELNGSLARCILVAPCSAGDDVIAAPLEEVLIEFVYKIEVD